MLLMTLICCCLIEPDQNKWISALAPREASRYEYEFGAMGSYFRIVGYTENSQRFKTATREIELRIRRLDESLSDYRPDSEINRLADHAPHHHPVTISNDLWRICNATAALNQQSQGTFDPTIGPVSRIWRLARKRNRLPDRNDIDAAMKSVGWSKVFIDPEKKMIQLTVKGMQLDFGGIAKGFAADEAIDILEQHKIHSALVDAGGDLRASNPPPGKRGWTIAIENGFRSPAEESTIKISIANLGVATSGDALQRIINDGHSHSHVLDPHTGHAVQDSCGVTVIADDATTADAWASALSVLGPQRGIEILNNRSKLHALFKCPEHDGLPARMIQTDGMEKFLTDDSVTNPTAGVGN